MDFIVCHTEFDDKTKKPRTTNIHYIGEEKGAGQSIACLNDVIHYLNDKRVKNRKPQYDKIWIISDGGPTVSCSTVVLSSARSLMSVSYCFLVVHLSDSFYDISTVYCRV